MHKDMKTAIQEVLQPSVLKSSIKIDAPITDLPKKKKKFEELSSDHEDWIIPLKAKLISPKDTANLKELKDYVLSS